MISNLQALSMFFSIVLMIALVAEAVSEAIVDSLPLDPIREWVSDRSDLFGVLVSCGKCVSFWASLAATAFIWTRSHYDSWTFLVAWLAAWRLSSVIHDVYGFIRRRVESSDAEAERTQAVAESVRLTSRREFQTGAPPASPTRRGGSGH